MKIGTRLRVEASPDKRFSKLISTNKKLSMAVHTSHPCSAESVNRRIMVQAGSPA
jgi:hypothetical protein